MSLKLNTLPVRTAAPPIPVAKGWAASYEGGAGPLIDLSQAVPGYAPHPRMLERLAQAAGSPEAASYGDILGDPELRTAYAEHVSAVYRAPVGASTVAITAGCNQGFFVATIALAKAGDAVLLPSPCYFNHKMTLDMLGVVAIPLPCRAETGFVPDVHDAIGLLDERVRAIVLVTPNNPTGAVYPPATIGAFADLCSERGVALILDETYRDFLPRDAGPPHDLFDRPAWQDTVVQLYSFSKSYCIPGHRAGVIVAGEQLLAEAAKIMDCLQICAPRLPQRVLPWAMPALSNWRAKNGDEILRRAAAFEAAIAMSQGWAVRSIGAYFAYLEHPFPGRPAGEICEWLARERGVLCLPGSYFGPEQEHFVRAAFANVDVGAIGALPDRLTVNGVRSAL